MSIFNENVVTTALIMLAFFGSILLFLGKEFLVAGGFLKAKDNFFFYILTFAFNFAVYLTILQLGVRMFVSELTQSFQGISTKLLPGAIPGIDVPAVYTFGSPNAITFGFIAAAIGQLVAILGLIVFKSPILIVAGFVPMFFGDGTLAVFANHKGGIKAALAIPFITGIIAVLGSATLPVSSVWLNMVASTVSSTGYSLARFCLLDEVWWIFWRGVDCHRAFGDTADPVCPNKDTYFLITDDFAAYKEKMENKA